MGAVLSGEGGARGGAAARLHLQAGPAWEAACRCAGRCSHADGNAQSCVGHTHSRSQPAPASAVFAHTWNLLSGASPCCGDAGRSTASITVIRQISQNDTRSHRRRSAARGRAASIGAAVQTADLACKPAGEVACRGGRCGAGRLLLRSTAARAQSQVWRIICRGSKQSFGVCLQGMRAVLTFPEFAIDTASCTGHAHPCCDCSDSAFKST